MKSTIYLLLILFFSGISLQASAQSDTNFTETKIVLHTKTGDIFGTLTLPENENEIPVALLIAGSGPTDRDGNNPVMKNDGLKKLSYSLAMNNIASLRYDKRGIAESAGSVKSEADLRFTDYVEDAVEWIKLLKQDKRFSEVIVLGHSEGSLIGMIAGEAADKYISVAGAGRSADLVLKEQLGAQPKNIQDLCFPIIDSLKNGKTVKDVNPMLYSLFRPSVQPYMISWLKFDPQTEIKKLSIPLLIIQGTNDIQISTEDAKLLAKANPAAKLVIIEKMNHIFRLVEGDRQANIETYAKSELPVSEEMVNNICSFIKN
jgi:fermentation-respiration switch protein FrsA (DUF1100 family)